MKLFFSKLLYFTLIYLLVLSCNYEPSLQTYYVDHQGTSGFIAMDFPVSFLDIDTYDITESEQKAINSIQKFNMLGYSLKSGSDIVYKAELNFVKQLLKEVKYNELFRLGNSKDGRIKIYAVGEDHNMDKVVILLNSNQVGFAVIRVLGKDMNLSEIMQLGPLIEKLDLDYKDVDNFFWLYEVIGFVEIKFQYSLKG
jgi:hypothetical protein